MGQGAVLAIVTLSDDWFGIILNFSGIFLIMNCARSANMSSP